MPKKSRTIYLLIRAKLLNTAVSGYRSFYNDNSAKNYTCKGFSWAARWSKKLFHTNPYIPQNKTASHTAIKSPLRMQSTSVHNKTAVDHQVGGCFHLVNKSEFAELLVVYALIPNQLHNLAKAADFFPIFFNISAVIQIKKQVMTVPTKAFAVFL